MSPTPEQMTRSLLGACQALHFVLTQIERKAALTIWNAEPTRQQSVAECILEAAKAFSDAIERCTNRQGGGQAPNCPTGFHEEFDICVPDP